MKVLTTRRYVLPEAPRALPAQQTPAPVQPLLAGCQTQRPEGRQTLTQGCATAIKNRKAADD